MAYFEAKTESNSEPLMKPATLPLLLTLITYIHIGNEIAGESD
jgi:hypothetical protein